MRKKIILLATVATLSFAMTACSTAQTNNTPTSTVETTKEVEAATEPTVTEEATEASTEAPTVTVESTEVHETTPDTEPESSAVNPADIPEDPNFTKIKEMAADYDSNYSDYVDIIETMDESRYVVNAIDNLDLVLEDGLTDDEKAENESKFLNLAWFSNYTEENSRYPWSTVPTGEYYVMTLTDLVTNETVVWGFRVHLENTEKEGTYYVAEEGTYLIWYMYFDSIQVKENYADDVEEAWGIEDETTAEPEQTEAPTETSGASAVEGDGTFAAIVDEINSFYTYEECEAYVETLDKSRYETAEVDNLDFYLPDGITQEQKAEIINNLFNSPYFGEYVKVDANGWADTYYVYYTGEHYFMTITDTVTGQKILWGVRMHGEDDYGKEYVLTKTANYVYGCLEAWVEPKVELDITGDGVIGTP